jgi:hypothetical protein
MSIQKTEQFRALALAYISLHDLRVAVCNCRAKQKTEQNQTLAILARCSQCTKASAAHSGKKTRRRKKNIDKQRKRF